MRELGNAQSQNIGRALSIAACLIGCAMSSLLGACNSYDSRFLHPITTHNGGGKDAGDDGSTPLPDGGDGGPCVPHTEICNGMDDDCNGVIDDAAAAALDCAGRVLHAKSICSSGVCLLVGCNSGFFNCNGEPSDGCEPICSVCNMCDDAGDDGGSADGGN